MRNILMLATLHMATGGMLAAIPQQVASTASPSFEIATVRVNHSEDRRGDHVDIFDLPPGGRFTATNCALKVLLGYAFQTQWFQIVGIPDKLRSQHFDINAKSEKPVPRTAYPAMLQRLLEDRFSLRVHWETKQAPVLYLVMDKPGKLKPAQYGDCSPPLTASSTAPPPPRHLPCGGLRSDPGNTEGYSLSADDLAESLAWFAQKPILDRTGLTGKYDVKLRWTPDEEQMRTGTTPDSDAPSFPTALRDQLGLRLEPGQGPVKILVIDRLESPSEN